MTLYAAIDLHSNNNYLVVIDERDQVVFRRKQANVLSVVLQALEPFRGQLIGIVVESTYNPSGRTFGWYWLVDGLMEAGWRVHLANTAAIQQYEGIKLKNDWTDAQWLAHLLRLGILPEGYISVDRISDTPRGSGVCGICYGNAYGWCRNAVVRS
jgi:hypothetical protein